VFKRFPKLRDFYSKAKVLWSKGKFISTIGVVSAETVKKYIAGQKEKDDSED
jgi:putative transposase